VEVPMRSELVVVMLALWLAFLPRQAAALCACGDRPSGCGSSPQCASKHPGDDCSPPKKSTCKIIEGTGTDLSCCCSCSPGAGPVSCAYVPVTETVAGLKSVTCDNAQLGKLTDKGIARTDKLLAAAETKCQKGKAGAEGKVTAAEETLNGLKAKVKKLDARGKLAPGCAATYEGLIDQYVQDIDQTAKTGTPPTVTSTSSTTTSTLSCVDIGPLSCGMGVGCCDASTECGPTDHCCTSVGQTCNVVGSTCCPGTDCVGGVCTAATCGTNHTSCTMIGDCCSGLICFKDSTNTPNRCCSNSTCSVDDDCCYQSPCISGTCQ
jgi:hypothetical protein